MKIRERKGSKHDKGSKLKEQDLDSLRERQ
jgi:hypothetical protein